MPPRSGFRAFVLALAVVATACGADAVVEETGAPPTTGADDIPQVLNFEAPLLGGGSLRGETLAGRDVAFWFWAPW